MCIVFIVLVPYPGETLSLSEDTALKQPLATDTMEESPADATPVKQPLATDTEEESPADATESTIDFEPPVSCCVPGETFVDLTTGEICDMNNPAVTTHVKPTLHPNDSGKCSMTAVFKVRLGSGTIIYWFQ